MKSRGSKKKTLQLANLFLHVLFDHLVFYSTTQYELAVTKYLKYYLSNGLQFYLLLILLKKDLISRLTATGSSCCTKWLAPLM